MRKLGALPKCLAIAGAIAAFASCKKESPLQQSSTSPVAGQMSTMSSQQDIQAITSRLNSFHQEVKTIKNGTPSNKMYSVDSSLFLIEAAYNYLCVETTDEEVSTYRFDFSVPKTGNSISANNVSQAFYRIKDSLLAKQAYFANLNTEENDLAFFDLSIQDMGSSVKFFVNTSFRIFWFPFNRRCKDSAIGEDNRGFLIYNAWGPGGGLPYTKGQCLIDMTTNNIVPGSIDNTLPGAASTIRSAGKRRFRGSCVDCGFYINISTVEDAASTVLTTPISPYVTNGVEGFLNDNIYNGFKFYPSASFDGFTYPNSNDPARYLKVYLTRPMLNFYIYQVPDIITANIAVDKTFYDFNIAHDVCLCEPNDPLSIYNDWGWTKPYQADRYIYFVSSGKKILDCNRTRFPIFNL
jgi:hypothetical protein